MLEENSTNQPRPEKKYLPAKIWVPVFLAAIIVAVLVIFHNIDKPLKDLNKRDANTEITGNELVNFFSTQLQQKVVTEIGQPIEGFEPAMFMQVYPGLQASDFDQVEALQGVYVSEGDQVKFVLNDVEPFHSAGQTISGLGMGSLLENISNRLGIEPVDQSSIEAIIKSLE